MHADDRLDTVLAAPATGDVAARIQYRQLLDLVGTLAPGARSETIDAAYLRLRELAARIPDRERAAVLADPALRLRSPRLLADLARAEHSVAAAAFRNARLDEGEWLDLIPALPIGARGLVRQRRNLSPAVEALLSRLGIAERALPPGPTPASNVLRLPERPPERPVLRDEEGIGAIVRRIEAFRQRRAAAPAALRPDPSAPPLPLAEIAELVGGAPLTAFDFAADSAGRILWADSVAAPGVVGLRLGSADPANPLQSDHAVAEALRRRRPLQGGTVELAGGPALAGHWRIDAAPGFDEGGRLTGWRGRFRRPPAMAAPLATAPGTTEADRIRQLLHELRTPVNAIQGFAEVIQQQLFGPTPHQYRALAASVAGDAARILAGFEDLDRLARLDTGALTPDAGTTDLTALVARLVAQLEAWTTPRSSGFVFEPADALAVALAPHEAERLCWRLLGTLAGAAAPGEKLKLKCKATATGVRLSLALPAQLARLDDPFHAEPNAITGALAAGMFGAGFALRLARSEASGAGGSLERRGDKLRLTLPPVSGDLTAPADDPSDEVGSVAATA